MGITMDFADNVTYGASDLNSLRCALATKGVLPEESSSCKVILGEEDGTVKISSGQALFSDGSRCYVDIEGVTLSVIGTSYVYFSRQENSVAVRTSSALPTGGNTVLLAKVTVASSGINITDMREYTVLKIPSCTVNTYDEFILKKKFNDAAVKSYDSSASLKSGTWCKVHEFEVSNQNYRYVCLFDNEEEVQYKSFLAWGDLNSGKYWSSYTTFSNGESTLAYGIDEIILYQNSTSTKRIRFVKNGSKVEVYYYSTVAGDLSYEFDGQIRFA
ncbi:MAG: hypothetical protein E7399_03070 [Ruminococcaceae bacterium]|nr:hypothetical protein [Oscillospiraceae bacterium]